MSSIISYLLVFLETICVFSSLLSGCQGLEVSIVRISVAIKLTTARISVATKLTMSVVLAHAVSVVLAYTASAVTDHTASVLAAARIASVIAARTMSRIESVVFGRVAAGLTVHISTATGFAVHMSVASVERVAVELVVHIGSIAMSDCKVAAWQVRHSDRIAVVVILPQR